MLLHGPLLFKEAIKVANDLNNSLTDLSFNYLDHARSLAGAATFNDWPDFIVAACWLHGIRYLDKEDAGFLIEDISAFNPETAKILKTLSSDNENEQAYYSRVSNSPFARIVLWLDTLYTLIRTPDTKTASFMINWLEDIYPTDVLNLAGFAASR